MKFNVYSVMVSVLISSNICAMKGNQGSNSIWYELDNSDYFKIGLDAVEKAVCNGADVNCLIKNRSEEYYSPLAICIRLGWIEGARFLLMKGASVYQANIIYLDPKKKEEDPEMSSLQLAQKSGKTTMVELLKEYTAE